MCCFDDLLSPKDLHVKYPQVELLGWTPQKIGTFLSSNLLIGTSKTARNPALIREKSFLNLVRHSNDGRSMHNILVNPTNRKTTDLLTPLELYDEYPRIVLWNWNAARIGMFLNCHLLIGIHKGNGRSALIVRPSFVALMELVNANLDYMKVYI